MGSEEKSTIQSLIDEAKRLGCPTGPCPCCKAAGGYRRHDSRRRQVLVVLGNFVVRCVILLVRWKCASCRASFTHYPEFLVPYKRYALSLMLAMSERYVTEPEATYRTTAAENGLPLGYACGEDGTVDERQMSHTTLWHWLTWLGGLERLDAHGLDLLRQKDPDFSLHRALAPIAPWKFRSHTRRCLLEFAASLVRTGAEFMRIFSRRIFPTLCNAARPSTG